MREFDKRIRAMYSNANRNGHGNIYLERINATANHLFWKQFSKKYGFEYAKTKSAR
jgi:hypothetical protein